jgi:phospholipase/carboxylesterase
MTRVLTSGRKGPARATSALVFLHGYGADGSDLLGLADVLGEHLPGTAFFAPDAPEPCQGNPFGRQWFPIPAFDGASPDEASRLLDMAAADADAFLDGVLAEEVLKPAQVALFGFSQGAMMSLHIAPRRALPLAGVVACSGRLLRLEQLAAEAVCRPPVLLMHGDEDQVVPFAHMAEAGRALDAAGFEVFGHVMRGAGHGISPDGLSAALGFLRERLGER